MKKNLSSYCGLVDEKIRASDKDLPVQCTTQCTRKSHILKWLLSYTPRTKKETVMGTLAFYELLDESAYIAVFLVTSHNTVWRGKFFI